VQAGWLISLCFRDNCLTFDLPFNSAYRHADWKSFLTIHTQAVTMFSFACRTETLALKLQP
jgi:hypothetical protein